MLQEIIADTFFDVAKMLPLLLAVYIAIELVEFKFGGAVLQKIKKAGKWGPFLGALAGIVPQCGFSVIAAALYVQRLATLGTLLAVFLATSDEAVPVLLANPQSAPLVLPLVLAKFFIALVAGYAVDLVFKNANRPVLEHIKKYDSGHDDAGHHHESVADQAACCGHIASSQSKKFDPKQILLHPVFHTLKISVFIFFVLLAINFAVGSIGQAAIAEFLSGKQAVATMIMAFFGLIPACAVSVAIAEFYLNGMISAGAALAGLCAGAGLGILVLFKEEKNKKNIFLVIALLLFFSVAAGLLLEF